MGFLGSLRTELQKKGFARTELTTTDGFVDMELYFSRALGKRIVALSSPYGDQMIELLETLYKRGMRRLNVIGTAGALDPSFQVGDVVIPMAVVTPGIATFEQAVSARTLKLPNVVSAVVDGDSRSKIRIHKGATHGSTRTPLEQSSLLARFSRNRGVQTIDVELRYVAEFVDRHPDVTLQAALIVSDSPLGRHTLEQHNSTAEVVYQSFLAVMPHMLFRRVAATP